MRYFVDKFLDKNRPLKILDVGSMDVNGTYKAIFKNVNWHYSGLDIIDGPNVDIVSKGAYDFGLDTEYDVVISGNCLEHVEAPWKWIKEVEKATKKGGLVCIITPFAIGIHRHPVDCYRILPDGYRYLLEQESNFKVLEAEAIKRIHIFHRPSLKWILKILPKYLIKKLEFIPNTYVVAFKK